MPNKYHWLLELETTPGNFWYFLQSDEGVNLTKDEEKATSFSSKQAAEDFVILFKKDDYRALYDFNPVVRKKKNEGSDSQSDS